MSGKKSVSYTTFEVRNIPSVRRLWGREISEEHKEIINISLDMWGWNFLEPEFKNFIFKVVQGQLYLNGQLSNFMERGPQCTFCKIIKVKKMGLLNIGAGGIEYQRRINRLNRETLEHFFWECNASRQVIKRVINPFVTAK